MIHEFRLRLPRHAFSPRDAARAGDIWRACQEIATDGSIDCGWPPGRYRDAGIGFVVREMTVVHHRETPHGEPLTARTWVRDFKRGMITDREIRIAGPSGPLADATQEWVHVRLDPKTGLKAARAASDLVSAFALVDPEPPPTLPSFDPVDDAPTHVFEFEAWHTAMDPLGHANHPAYVDWSDEALARAAAAAGGDPQAIAPVAEVVRWKLGVTAGERVRVETRLVGTAGGAAVVRAEIRKLQAGALVSCATATLFRRAPDDLAARLLRV